MDGMISFKQLERIYSNDSSRTKFITALQQFLISKRDIIPPGILNEVPVYSGKPIDLYELFHQVDRREGFDRVNYMNRWQEIIDIMKLQTTPLSLRECYIKYLRLFEEAIRKRAQQQQQQPHHQQQQQQLQQQQQHLLQHPPTSQSTLAPRPPTRPLETPDLSAMPPQKRPRPEMAAGPSAGTPQPPNSNISRQTVQRAQSVPSSQQTNPNSYSMTSLNMSASSSNTSGSIVVSTGHINTAIKSLLSSDQNSIKQGLNYLMQLSLEGDNSRNILFVEKYPTLITALGSLLDTINPFTKLLFTLTSNELLDPAFNISQYLLSGNDRVDIFWNQTNPLDHDNVLQVLPSPNLLQITHLSGNRSDS
jgi:hypothetical protein